jgi:hypothetical protein
MINRLLIVPFAYFMGSLPSMVQQINPSSQEAPWKVVSEESQIPSPVAFCFGGE